MVTGIFQAKCWVLAAFEHNGFVFTFANKEDAKKYCEQLFIQDKYDDIYISESETTMEEHCADYGLNPVNYLMARVENGNYIHL